MADSTQRMPMLEVANRCDRLIDDGADAILWIRKDSELAFTTQQVWKFAETRELSVPNTLRGGVRITGGHQVDANTRTI